MTNHFCLWKGHPMFAKLATACLAVLLLAPAVQAENFDVLMLNKGADGAMVYEPAFVKAAVGDTITFISTDKGHNAEGIKGMLPEGVEPFKSAMGADYVLTLTAEGVYGIKCTPHYSMGMVALIQVGAPVNLDAAVAVTQKGKAKTRFEPLFAQVAK
jgi:pseudoazurin